MSLPRVMSGVYLTRHGGPEALEMRYDIAVPAPGKGQVLVQVLAAGINNTDINTRLGWYDREVTTATDAVPQKTAIEAGGWGGALTFPRIQGGDICGRIVALGAEVDDFHIGQRVTCPINIPRPRPDNKKAYEVLGSERDGAFAQYCVLDAVDLYDVSAAPLSNIEIAAIPCAYGTAETLLTRAGVSKDQQVLITGASGNVGLAAVQLAALRGAQVTALAAPQKAAAVRSAGASSTLGRDANLPEGQFDAVIDVVAGSIWPQLIMAVRPGGQYAVAGAIAGPVVPADLRDIYLRDITIHGCTFQPPEVFRRLIDLINQGLLRPMIAKTYPLSNITQAQADFVAKTYVGKLVLIPEDPNT